ncbi:hypothetical protein VNO78_18896 [Psophocarpus tetragonolobus]|uniref:Uncharacterized protein n=1 Tax=Psophocarpus tetragonolobus TaxID=3891 RepID=A0AAN9S852_PSOTE
MESGDSSKGCGAHSWTCALLAPSSSLSNHFTQFIHYGSLSSSSGPPQHLLIDTQILFVVDHLRPCGD